MAYGSIYEAVSDLYDSEDAWDELVRAGSRESFNVAEESLGRHDGSDGVGLRLKDFTTGETETYTWTELNRGADRMANFLDSIAADGARVAACLPAQFELYATVFGTIESGRIYVPLAPVFGPDALHYRLDDSGASVLVTTSDHLAELDPEAVPNLETVVTVDGPANAEGFDVVSYEAVSDCEDHFETVDSHPQDIFTVKYTSGTTGQPKGCPSRHRSMLSLHAYMKYVVDLRPDDNYFVAASPAWSYGLIAGTTAAGVMDAPIGCYRGPFDPAAFMETLEEFAVDNTMVPPTALRQLRASAVDPDDYDVDLRVLVSAGEALDQESVTWCEEKLGAQPQDAFGQTESGMLVCNYAFDDWEVKAGSMGKPTPGKEVKLLDDDGNEVDVGETGEIAYKRDPESVGEYWGKPEATVENFSGTWGRTGDLARRDEDGYYWYVSRKDAVIISAGYRIGPGEVEETLLTHDAIEEVGVTGESHETRGEIVAAYVTLGAEFTPSEELRADITEYAKAELSKHEYPRKIEFVDELPKTSSGKIKRAELGGD